MHKESLSYMETERKFGLSNSRAHIGESIYQKGGTDTLAEERRGKGATDRPRSIPNDDLIAELEYLRAENAF